MPQKKQNYQAMLDEIIATECRERRPSLLLHACCAPCSSYVLEYLAPLFDITLFFQRASGGRWWSSHRS